MTDERLLPVKNRIEPFWLSARDSALCNARTTKDLPSHADVVVVGSGLSGCMTAYHLQKQSKAKGKHLNIVMLEADEFCGSSTARNGGHCKPLTFLGYRTEASKYGKAVANQIMEFEENALKLYTKLVEDESIDCDLNVTRAFDIFFDQEDADKGKLDLIARKKDHPNAFREADIRPIDDPRLIEQVTGVKGAVWAVSYPAGHLWPYRLAAALAHIGRRNGLNLQTHTPALSITQSSSPKRSQSEWTIKTPRGSITAPVVFVTTNAYTSSLLPEFKDKIVPVRGTACSITPSPSHSSAGIRGTIPYTFGFRYGVGDTDYMIARQGRGRIPGKGDNSIILGGAKGVFLKDPKLWYDNIYDNEEMPGVRRYFERLMRRNFSHWDGNEKGNVDNVWSGILGYSNDFVPYVGPHPDRPGVFVCAGFTGHGMPRIPGCTLALTPLALSYLESEGTVLKAAQDHFEAIVPKTYHVTKERLASRVNIIREYMGTGGKASGALEVNDEAAMMAKNAVKAKL